MQENEVPISPEQYNEILDFQQKILTKVAAHEYYITVLEDLCFLAEKLLPNSVASIMKLDEATGLMNVLVAPSVPKEGHEALANLKPGLGGGSCGNAVFTNEAQYVSNTFEDKRWEDLRLVAYDYNLCACWSMPFLGDDGRAIGTFALSSFEHRSPSAFHKKLLEVGALIVKIVLKNQEKIYIDEMTNLYNKPYLEKLLKSNEPKTLLLLNINNFSYINTAYGFHVGDKLLKEIANILKYNFKTQATCRIDADEFAMLFEGQINIEYMVNQIKECFYSQAIQIDDITLNISFSYGASYGSLYNFRNSALALKQAKENGKNRLYVYKQDKESIDQIQRQAFIEANNTLHKALGEDAIVPFFQGIRDNETQKINKFECLARIRIGTEIITPDAFLEAAKLSGLLPEITKVMIDKSFQIMQHNNTTFSLNITEDDLSHRYLFEYIAKKSLQYKISPSRVILEILEGVSSGSKEHNLKQLKEFKEAGYKIAIDDFGTEYSNFERVLDLEIDFLKIDARYIKDIDTNKQSYEITKAIAFFAHNAGITCIAEFVHNQKIQNIIETLGIEYSQGYLYSEPSLVPQIM